MFIAKFGASISTGSVCRFIVKLMRENTESVYSIRRGLKLKGNC